jgi:thiamine-monophosphate kinase
MKNKKYPSEEYSLLELLKPLLNYKKSARYPIGIGDDAALRRTKEREQLVFTADTMVENVHFSLSYMSMNEVGYKAMAVNLSDVAAMGARPDGALVQIIFPMDLKKAPLSRQLIALYRGMNLACKEWNYPIIGGNLSKGPCYVIDITLIGRLGKKNNALTRKGARNGDGLWVTGVPGSSAAGLFSLKKWGSPNRIPQPFKPFVQSHIHPVPRIETGEALAINPFVHAMIDVSDGIAKECHTLAFENNVGILLEIPSYDSLLPLRNLARDHHQKWISWFLYGGEDYELLFAASPGFDPKKVSNKMKIPITRIGTFTTSVKGVKFRFDNGILQKVGKSGWDHLKK